MNFSQFSFACYWLVLLADFRETFSQGTSAARMSPLRIRRGVVCSTRPSHVLNLPVRAAAPISWCTSLSFVRARPFEFLRTRSRHLLGVSDILAVMLHPITAVRRTRHRSTWRRTLQFCGRHVTRHPFSTRHAFSHHAVIADTPTRASGACSVITIRGVRS